MRELALSFITLFFFMAAAPYARAAQASPSDGGPPYRSFSIKTALDVASRWPDASRRAARDMIERYGAPDHITRGFLIWEKAGDWEEIIARRDPIEHNFPAPHMDTLEQAAAYEVPEDKFDDLAVFDGSIIAERTRGTISSRSWSEAMNCLALNLAHDIITNIKTVEEAREAYAAIANDYMQGKEHPYTRGLRFRGSATDVTRDPDYYIQDRRG
ncbi:MAG TPA: hypothetical protein VII64_10085 [Thermodesulfobacteriota bacterium]